MSFTYSLANDTGLLRLEIGDTIEDKGCRPDGRNFSDEELAIFLAEGSVGRGAGRACEVLSTEWSAHAGTQRLGPMSDARQQAKSYADRAKMYRSIYGRPVVSQTAAASSKLLVRDA